MDKDTRVKVNEEILNYLINYYLNSTEGREELKKDMLDYNSRLAGAMEYLSFYQMHATIKTFIEKILDTKDPEILKIFAKSKILLPAYIGTQKGWDFIPIINDEYLTNIIRIIANKINPKLKRIVFNMSNDFKETLSKYDKNLLNDNEKIAEISKKVINTIRKMHIENPNHELPVIKDENDIEKITGIKI